jgi:N-acyl-D-aspartate/D-glutamate deacylase
MMVALTHPDVIVGSDGMVYVDEDANLLPADAPFGAGLGHPRGAGTYAKYLRLAIEDGSLSLRQILAKTSYLPARFIEDFAPSMKYRGRLQEGMFADITIFDPDLVTDNAGYAPGTSSLPSTGFVYVLVNGQTVVSGGALLENVFPGEPIRGEQLPR